MPAIVMEGGTLPWLSQGSSDMYFVFTPEPVSAFTVIFLEIGLRKWTLRSLRASVVILCE